MPRFAPAVAVLIALALSAAPALAEPKTRVRRIGSTDAVYVGARRMWTGARGERVVSRVRWSKTGDAVAFAVRRRTGGDQLVVVLVGGDADRHTMRWPIPVTERPRRRGKPTVTWMGNQRVAYGPTELRPTVVASWTMR